MHIDSLKTACELRGYDPENSRPDVMGVPEKFKKMVAAYADLLIITEAANEGREPNWKDSDEEKYIAIADMEMDENNPTGFRYVVSLCGYTGTGTGAGSGLCFLEEGDEKWHFEKHIDLYRDAMTFSGH